MAETLGRSTYWLVAPDDHNQSIYTIPPSFAETYVQSSTPLTAESVGSGGNYQGVYQVASISFNSMCGLSKVQTLNTNWLAEP